MPDFSDYIVCVDESGTPTLKNIDKDFPYLVLAFLIVKKAIMPISSARNFKILNSHTLVTIR